MRWGSAKGSAHPLHPKISQEDARRPRRGEATINVYLSNRRSAIDEGVLT
jgi:hypothetical protein